MGKDVVHVEERVDTNMIFNSVGGNEMNEGGPFFPFLFFYIFDLIRGKKGRWG